MEVSKDLRPRAQAAYAEAHARVQELLAHPQVQPRPLPEPCQASQATVEAEHEPVSTSPQVKGFRKRSETVLGEVEDFLASHLRRVPLLAPYADKPYSTRLVYLLVAAPLLAVAMPLLLLGGAEPRNVIIMRPAVSCDAVHKLRGVACKLLLLGGAELRRVDITLPCRVMQNCSQVMRASMRAQDDCAGFAGRAQVPREESSLSSAVPASERSKAQQPAAKVAAAKKRDKVRRCVTVLLGQKSAGDLMLTCLLGAQGRRITLGEDTIRVPE